MRAVVQRVTRASVTVAGPVGGSGPAVDRETIGAIGAGLCVLVGVTHDDSEATARKLAERLWKLRIFADDEDRMNLSVADVGGALLIISQFTLYGDSTKGRRPSFVGAAPPEEAEPLVDAVVSALEEHAVPTASGRFGADMAVTLTNDGPVTLVLDVIDGRVA